MTKQRNSKYLSCRVTPNMFDEITAIASEDGISKSGLVRGLVAGVIFQRIERRLMLRLARPPRPCYPAPDVKGTSQANAPLG